MNFSAFLKITFIIGVLLSLISFLLPGRFTHLTIGYLLITHVSLYFLALRYHRYSLLSPFVLLYFVFYLANLLRGLYIHSVESIDFFKYFLVNVPFENFEYGAMLVAISSFTLLIAGESNKLSILNKRLPTNKNKIQLKMSTIILLLIGVVILYLILSSSQNPLDISAKRKFEMGDGETTRFGPIRFAFNIVLFALQLIFFMKLFSKKSLLKDRLMLLSFIFIIIASIIISKRSFILLTILPMVLMSFHKINWIKSIKLLGLISIFAVLISYIGSQRGNNAAGASATSFSKIIYSTTNAAMLQANYGGIVATTISSIVIKGQYDILLGETFLLDPVLQFIPRSIYPNKPEELGGRIRIIHQRIGVAPVFIEGGVPPGVIAEAWLNGGIVFVVIISLLLGILFSFISIQMKLSNSPFLLAKLFFISETIVFFGFGGHTARVTNYIISMYIGIFLIYLISLLFKKRGY